MQPENKSFQGGLLCTRYPFTNRPDSRQTILCSDSPGGPGGAAGRGPVLHDFRAGDLGGRRVADERVAHAGAQAVRGRDVLPGAEVHQHPQDPGG